MSRILNESGFFVPFFDGRRWLMIPLWFLYDSFMVPLWRVCGTLRRFLWGDGEKS